MPRKTATEANPKPANDQLGLAVKFVSKDPCSTEKRCDADRIVQYELLTKEAFERYTICDNHRDKVVEKIKGARAAQKVLDASRPKRMGSTP